MVVGDSAEAVREQLVSDWWAAHNDLDPPADQTASPGVMIAARVADIDDLNDRARQRLEAAGLLTGPELRIAGRAFAAGDQIVCGHNDRRLGVINGTRATVTAVDTDQMALHIRTGDGRQLTLPAAYLEAGHVRHAYALTGHKARGMTVDQAWVLGSDQLYREWGYTAMSRHRDQLRLYLVAGSDQPDDLHHHGVDESSEPIPGLVQALRRSRAQELGVDSGAVAALTRRTPDQLRDERDRLRALLAAGPSAPTADADRRLRAAREDAGQQRDAAAQRVADAETAMKRVTGVGRLLRRSPRHTATADLTRTLSQLDAWDERLTELDQRLADHQRRHQLRDAWLADHHTGVTQLQAIDAALDRQRQQPFAALASARGAPADACRPASPSTRFSTAPEIEERRDTPGDHDHLAI